MQTIYHNIITAHGGTDSIPVVVKPGSIAGDDDVMGLLSHVVLRVDQTIDLCFALFIILLSITVCKHPFRTV